VQGFAHLVGEQPCVVGAQLVAELFLFFGVRDLHGSPTVERAREL
jgi:hypothetical protein